VSKTAARAILIAFSLLWIGATLVMLLGGILGDCFDDTYSRCWASKDYAPTIVFWRGVALELMAIVIYLLYTRRRTK
jgi:hypothetical protein